MRMGYVSAVNLGLLTVLPDRLTARVDARIPNQSQIVIGGQHQHEWPSACTSGPASPPGNLERVGIRIACQGSGLEQPPSAGIDQIALAELPVPCGGEISLEKPAGRRRETSCFPIHNVHFCRTYIGETVLEFTIERSLLLHKLMTSKHYRERRPWSLLTSNYQRFLQRNVCFSLMVWALRKVV